MSCAHCLAWPSFFIKLKCVCLSDLCQVQRNNVPGPKYCKFINNNGK